MQRRGPSEAGRERKAQLAYSELTAAMGDETLRRKKAAKILAVLLHALGRTNLSGLTVTDVGCSQGFIADEMASAGAALTIGVDIDVPGLAAAQLRFADSVRFACAAGEALPLPDSSVDVVIFNHIYEHVVDPDAVVADIRRVLRPRGLAYLGLGNRLGVVEPHYHLPFLSYLPPAAADRYVRASGRADHYHERFRTRRGLVELLAGWHVLDYTLPVLAQPDIFSGDDIVPSPVSRLPEALLAAALPLVPTYIWLASPSPIEPAGTALRVQPRIIQTLAPHGKR